MKKFVRIVFFGGAALLWVVLLLLAAEVYHAYYWRRVEAENPYVRARRGDIPWPASDATLDPKPPRDPASESAQLPPPDPLELWARRVAYFAALSPQDRNTFAHLYQQNVHVVGRSGASMETYATPVPRVTPASIKETSGPEAARAVNGRLPSLAGLEQVDLPEAGLCVRLSPLPPSDGVAWKVAGVFIEGAFPEEFLAPPDSTYAVPWFMYKPHMSLSRRSFSPTDLGVEQFTTNNFGFRDDDVVMPKPDGVFRILCIGASTTEEGPNNAATYPNLLENALNEALPGRRFDVVNCGIAGMNLTKERMRMADYLAMDPDLIIVYNAVNDITHFHFRSWVNQASAWQRLLRRSRFMTHHFNALFVPDEASIAGALRSQTLVQVVQMRDYAREHGAELAVCSFAAPDIENLPRVERDYYDLYAYDLYAPGQPDGRYITFSTYCRVVGLFNRELEALCREEGIPYIPVAENVRGGAELFGDVCHMKNRGILMKARVIAEHLAGPLSSLLGQDSAVPVAREGT